MAKFIGLEVNSHSIGFANLRVSGKKLHLLKCGRVKVDTGETDTQKMISSFKSLLNDVDLLDTKVISTIINPRLFVREFIFPQMTNKELQEAVRWKVKEHLTFPLEEAIIDVKITEKISEGQFKRLKVLIVAIPQEAIMQHIDMLKAMGVMPSVVTIGPLAFENLLKHMKIIKDEVIATLNISPGSTFMNIYKNQKLEFARMITSKIERLPLEIRLSLDYFIEESHGSNVEKMIIFGEQAELREVVNILGQQLPLPLETIDPLKDTSISYSPTCLRSKEGLISGQQIAISLGAALSHDRGINLLSQEAKIQIKNYFSSAGARLLAILGSFIFLFIYFNLQFHIVGYKERLIAAEAEAETLAPLISEIEPVENLSKEVSSRLALASSLLARRGVWSGMLKQISQILPRSITLSDISVNETDISFKGEILSPKESPENILSNFIVSLEKGIFKNVSLVSAQKYEDSGVLEFNLAAQVDF